MYSISLYLSEYMEVKFHLTSCHIHFLHVWALHIIPHRC